MMRSIIHLSEGSHGGAETAALRIHACLLGHGDLPNHSLFRCLDDGSPEAHRLKSVTGPVRGSHRVSRSLQFRRCVRHYRGFLPLNQEAHSIAYPATGMERELRQMAPSVVHLHNIRNHSISIEEIGRLPLPIIWSAHDHWPFVGAEHHPTDTGWLEGYPNRNDLCSWTWNRKRKHLPWRTPVICASRWMETECRRSALADRFEPLHIPYPLDTQCFHPANRATSRAFFNFSFDDFVLVFGATGGFLNPRKGGIQLIQALQILRHLVGPVLFARLHLVVFGQKAPAKDFTCPIRCTFLGNLAPDAVASLFSSADLTLVPSLQEPLGQVAIESLACGTPVLSSSTGGLLDNVIPGKTGLLAEADDPHSLAHGMAAALALDPTESHRLGAEGVRHVVATCSESVIASRLHEAYGLAEDFFKANKAKKHFPGS